MLAVVLDKVEKAVAPGISTKELAALAAAELERLGGQPAFLNHDGFPDVMTISINEEIVHGVPSSRRQVKDGDVVGLDFGVMIQGLIVDGARTIYVGNNPPVEVKKLLEATERALYTGIDAVKGDGTKVGDISAAIQEVLDKAGLGIIRDLVGHGVGDKMHENPNIPNYGVRGGGMSLSAGMTVAIEPMASLGDWRIATAEDGWTIVMADGSLSAHFEHTVLITEKSAEILTTL